MSSTVSESKVDLIIMNRESGGQFPLEELAFLFLLGPEFNYLNVLFYKRSRWCYGGENKQKIRFYRKGKKMGGGTVFSPLD